MAAAQLLAAPPILFVGDDKPAYATQIVDSVSLAAVNLTGLSSITYKLVDRNSQAVITGTGTVTVVTASTGSISLAWNAADTATAGAYWLELLIHWTSSDLEHVLPAALEVKYAP